MSTILRKNAIWLGALTLVVGLMLVLPLGSILAHGDEVQPPKYLASNIDGAHYFDYAPRGSDSGAELRVTQTGMWVLSNGTLGQQQWWAELFARWFMGQPQWPEDSDRTLQGVAKEIHCHANRWVFSSSSVNVEYNWGDVEFAERLGCWMWSP